MRDLKQALDAKVIKFVVLGLVKELKMTRIIFFSPFKLPNGLTLLVKSRGKTHNAIGKWKMGMEKGSDEKGKRKR